jgi:uncharacterized membrane protein YjgN (DUF898 family)
LSTILAFVLLAGFGQYAVYRARRYRLTRTVFRGLRFHQAGSAVHYAVRAMLWWIPIGMTLGLASPWATANLERYKMRNTFYGNLGGSFAGAGGRLFGRTILIWFLVISPFVVAVAAAVTTIDWAAVADTLEDEDTLGLIVALGIDAPLMRGIGLLIPGVVWAVVASLILYPAYQAIVMRWWLGGLRLGGTAVASDLRMRRYYGAYLQYLLYVALFSIAFFSVAAVIGGIGYIALRGEIDLAHASLLRDGLLAGSGLIAYVIYIVGVSTIYQVTVKMRLWQVAVESMLISGIATLDHVQAGEATSSAVGEGLADALGAGAI